MSIYDVDRTEFESLYEYLTFGGAAESSSAGFIDEVM